MPAELRLTGRQFDELNGHVLSDDDEHAAVLSCEFAGMGDGLLLCRSVYRLSTSDLDSESGRWHLRVSPLTLGHLIKRAKLEGRTLVMCHSHPFPGPVAASSIDLRTERELCGRVIPGRLAGRPSGSIIVGPDGIDGRLWAEGKATALRVRAGGRLLGGPNVGDAIPDEDRDSRQLLIWGSRGQQQLHEAVIAVVGAGGTGSHVVQQLAHLGIGRLIVVDPDIVEPSNLGRLVGAKASDVGRRKVDVLAASARRIRPGICVKPIAASALEMDPRDIAAADIIVSCTDSHGSRAMLTELVAQYLLTLVDLGVEIQGTSHGTRAGGGVRVVRPGEPCLHCVGIIDSGLVREEFLSDSQRLAEANRGYLKGEAEPAPSVVALNGVVASLAVMEVLHELLGLFADGTRRVLYRAEARATTTARTSPELDCFVCGRNGLLGLGDSRQLPRRIA